MKQFINSKFAQILVLAVAFVVFGAGVFSMAAMSHQQAKSDCIDGMSHSMQTSLPSQSAECINFHFSLLEKFSLNVIDYSGFQLWFIAMVLYISWVFAVSVLWTVFGDFMIRKVRLRQFLEETCTVFRDNLGYWLSIFEKRDPAYSFHLA